MINDFHGPQESNLSMIRFNLCIRSKEKCLGISISLSNVFSFLVPSHSLETYL